MHWIKWGEGINCIYFKIYIFSLFNLVRKIHVDCFYVESIAIYFLNLSYQKVSAITFCEKSSMKVRYVERCPADLKSWEKAAKDMDCESIKHNCSQTISKGNHRFQYHCVINTWMNASLEVCAPNRTIFGTVYKVHTKFEIKHNFYSTKDLLRNKVIICL